MSETKFAQPIFSRRTLMLAGGALLLLPGRASRSAFAAVPTVEVFRNPGCSCCEIWAGHMRRAGFSITMVDDPELAARRAGLGVPEAISGCHTALIGDYVVEGHVPPEDVMRLLAEKPRCARAGSARHADGIAGHGWRSDGGPYDVLIFTAGASWKVYASH